MVSPSGRDNIWIRLTKHVRSIKIRLNLRNNTPTIFVMLWGVAIACGFVGYWWADYPYGDSKSVIDTFYATMQLFFANYKLTSPPPNLPLQFARFLAPVLMFSTIVLILASHLDEIRQRFVIRFFTRNHIIVCGLGLLGPILVERFCKDGHRVIVIEKNLRPDETDQCKSYGAFVLKGDASSPQMLKAAGIQRAKYLITVTGEDELNAEISGCAAAIRHHDPVHPITAYLHIVDMDLFNLLKETEFQYTSPSGFRLDLFNLYQPAGNMMLDHPLPFITDEADLSRVRLLIIGVGRLGESLIFHAAKKWRAHWENAEKKLHITLIDKNADEKLNLLLLRYPALKRFCEFQSKPMDITSSEFCKGDFLTEDPGEIPYSRIYICVGNPVLGLTAGLTIHNKLQELDPSNPGRQIPVVIRTNTETGLSHYLVALKIGDKVLSNMHAFSLREEICKDDKILITTHEVIARAIHADYINNERKNGKTPEINPRMASWDELQEEYKESNRLQADHIIQKLKAIHCRVTPLVDWDEPLFEFAPREVEMLAEQEHKRWMEEKKAARWKPGPKRDDRWWHKRHDLLVPFNELSEENQNKDLNAVRLIPTLLNSVDLKIKRL